MKTGFVILLLLVPVLSGCLSEPAPEGEDPHDGPVDDTTDAEPTTLHLHCEKDRPSEIVPPGYIYSMEGTYLPPDEEGRRHCWAHLGHHHYFVGANHTFRLLGGEGRIFYVEQVGFSPSTDTPETGEGEDALVTPVPIEVSQDGLTWTPVALLDHAVVSLSVDSWDTTRQAIEFSFASDGELFRFLRVRAPESVYTGLSGFLDHSRMQLQVEVSTPTVAPARVHTLDQRRDCTAHIMEAFLEDSPCTFGGYVHEEYAPIGAEPRIGNLFGQWDAPSFFHTYPLGGEAFLDAIRGDVEVRDYRNNAPPASREIWVQVSPDARNWTTVHTFPVTKVSEDPFSGQAESGLYQGTFEVRDVGVEAAFVRLVAEHMETWFDRAPDRHPWAFFRHSEIGLDGLLPSG